MRWNGEKSEKNIPSSSPLLSNSEMQFGHKCQKKELMQAALTAFKSLLQHSAAQVQLSGRDHPRAAGTDRAMQHPGKALAPPSAACQTMPALGELGEAGLALRDRSSPGLSQQYPSNTSTLHTHACSTHIPLLPKGSRERQVFPLLHPKAALGVDGLRTAHGSTALSPVVKILSVIMTVIPRFS